MATNKILIVEDEPKVASFIQQGLEEHGYEVDVVYDGWMGKRFACRNHYEVVILDIIIPHTNGIELCRQIREVKPGIPILMLTALGTVEDKVAGFDAGADDYLVKPFEFKELLARIRALSKRAGSICITSNVLKAFDLELDIDKKQARRGDKVITLTAKEFSLLEFFMRNKGRVLSRAEIAQKVWDVHFDTGTNVVDVYVNILRKKIDRDFDTKLIHTRFGLGYVFNEQP